MNQRQGLAKAVSKLVLLGALVALVAVVGTQWGTAQVDLGKTLYVENGCYACHGSFNPLDEWDAGAANAGGSAIGAPIAGWNAVWLKKAVHDGLFVKVNVTGETAPSAQVYSEGDVSDAQLKDITAYLNPNFKDGNAANGESIYNDTCGTCHGKGADGGAETNLAPSIRFMPFEIVKSVARTGKLPASYSYAMPLYNNALSDSDIQAIADYLDSLDNWVPPAQR